MSRTGYHWGHQTLCCRKMAGRDSRSTPLPCSRQLSALVGSHALLVQCTVHASPPCHLPASCGCTTALGPLVCCAFALSHRHFQIAMADATSAPTYLSSLQRSRLMFGGHPC